MTTTENLIKAAEAVICDYDDLLSSNISVLSRKLLFDLKQSLAALEQSKSEPSVSVKNAHTDWCTLEIVKSQGGYTVSLDNAPGLIVEVDDLKDAPREIAKSVEVMLMYYFDEGKHRQFEIKEDKTVVEICEKPVWDHPQPNDGEEKQKRNPILEEFRKTISEETKQSVEIEMLKQDVEYYKAKYEKCIETIRKFDPGIKTIKPMKAKTYNIPKTKLWVSFKAYADYDDHMFNLFSLSFIWPDTRTHTLIKHGAGIVLMFGFWSLAMSINAAKENDL